jgi:two-component system nitrogen regulation response regulator GlnG
MSSGERSLAGLPLAELVRARVHALLEQLGSHRAPDLYRRVLAEVERALIEEALARSKGSRQGAAAILGLHRNSLRLRMQALGIKGEKS